MPYIQHERGRGGGGETVHSVIHLKLNNLMKNRSVSARNKYEGCIAKYAFQNSGY
jgi:hypothetical protein